MHYLNYDNYKEMGGHLSAAEFDRFAFRAERELDNATQGRIKALNEVPCEVKRCVFELIDYLSGIAENSGGSPIQSVSNDGYSVSYTNVKSPQAQISETIYTFLADTDLMYCGVEA